MLEMQRNVKPESVARTGSARWLLSRSASAISPSAILNANGGAGMTLGRLNACPSAAENSLLVIGIGPVTFRGPRVASLVTDHATMRTQSSLWIHGWYCRPEPIGPPAKR